MRKKVILGGVSLWMKLWENKLLESYHFWVMVSYGIVKDKHGMGDTGKIHVFKLLTLDFWLLRPQKLVIEGVVVGVSGKLVFLEAI